MKRSELQQLIREELAKARSKLIVTEAKKDDLDPYDYDVLPDVVQDAMITGLYKVGTKNFFKKWGYASGDLSFKDGISVLGKDITVIVNTPAGEKKVKVTFTLKK